MAASEMVVYLFLTSRPELFLNWFTTSGSSALAFDDSSGVGLHPRTL